MMDFTNLKDANINDLALHAYVYGYPLVFGMEQIKRYLKRGLDGKPTEYNKFSHATNLANAESRFVSVNNDTLYSWAAINLSGGPLILEVPDTNERYYVGQFIDVWTNNFAYIGKRSTGTKSIKCYLVPPNYHGETPNGLTRIEFPTVVGVLIFRWAISGESELPIIKRLQEQTKIISCSTNKQLHEVEDISLDTPEELVFFESLRVSLNQFPSSDLHQKVIETYFDLLGLKNKNKKLVETVDPEVQKALVNANKLGSDILQKLMIDNHKSTSKVNGWNIALHAFDYNHDYFEIGALAEPTWIIQDLSEAIIQRTLSAKSGLWGNNSYEAVYPTIWLDSEGEKLTGEHDYQVTFPPVATDGFWSLTMYDVPEFYLIDNLINRYSIGDRTQGIEYNDDGSLTVVLSSRTPQKRNLVKNWLPTPNGHFRPMLRVYLPREEFLNGTYILPPIYRMDSTK